MTGVGHPRPKTTDAVFGTPHASRSRSGKQSLSYGCKGIRVWRVRTWLGGFVTDSELLERIAELRGQGLSLKEIARSLGIRPAVVAPLVRRLAAQNAVDMSEAALVGCWVNQGRSEELGVSGQHGWPRGTPSDGSVGLAALGDHHSPPSARREQRFRQQDAR